MDDPKSQLEPLSGSEHYPLREHVEVSSAISLKRIADALSGITSTEGLARLLDAAAVHPVSVYGEGFADALQNSIERGLRGMNTNDLRK